MMTTPAHPELFAFIRIDTTGPNPHLDELLQLTVVVTDNWLQPVDDGITVIVEPDTPDWAMSIPPQLRETYVRSGLLDDIAHAAGQTAGSADREVAAYLDRHRAGSPVLPVGLHIAHARAFLEVAAPTTAARLHDDHLDLGSVFTFTTRVCDTPIDQATCTSGRGVDAVFGDIVRLRQARDRFVVPVNFGKDQ